MTLLLTGAAGQVGCEVVARRAGRPIVPLRRDELDIASGAAVERCLQQHRPSVVINAAAYTAVDRAETDAEAAYRANREGPAVLAAACAKFGIPLLHLSTDYVFDGSKQGPWEEDDTASPLGVYGASKWEGEQCIRSLLNQHLIIRVAWVFGAHGSNFVRTMIRLGRERPELRVVDDQLGAPTHAGAIAEMLLSLSDRIGAGQSIGWGTYHYTGTPSVTWCGFARRIFQKAAELGLLAKAPELLAIGSCEYPTPAARPANSVLALQRIRERLGIEPKPWEEGLCEVLSQWKNTA